MSDDLPASDYIVLDPSREWFKADFDNLARVSVIEDCNGYRIKRESRIDTRVLRLSCFSPA